MNSAEDALKTLIAHIGADPDSPALVDTPKRVLKAYKELFGGYDKDPTQILKKIPNTTYKDMIVIKDIEYFSTCQHHMQPFFGKAHVTYIPNECVTGLSKIPRLVDCFAQRLQNQEQMTQQVAETLATELNAKGVAVMVSGKHLCMCGRGVKQSQSETLTYCYLGDFENDSALRQEFLSQVR